MPGDFVELEARRLSYVPTIPLFFWKRKGRKRESRGAGKKWSEEKIFPATIKSG